MLKNIAFYVDELKNSNGNIATVRSLLIDIKEKKLDVNEIGTSGISILDTLVYYNVLSVAGISENNSTSILLHLSLGHPLKKNVADFFDKNVSDEVLVDKEKTNGINSLDSNTVHFIKSLQEFDGYKTISDRLVLLLLFKRLFENKANNRNTITNDMYEFLQQADYSFISNKEIFRSPFLSIEDSIKALVKTLDLNTNTLNKKIISLNQYYDDNNIDLNAVLKDLQSVGMVDCSKLNILRDWSYKDVSDIKGTRLINFGEFLVKDEIVKVFNNKNRMFGTLYDDDLTSEVINDFFNKNIESCYTKIKSNIEQYHVKKVENFFWNDKTLKSIKDKILDYKNVLSERVEFLKNNRKEMKLGVPFYIDFQHGGIEELSKKIPKDCTAIRLAVKNGYLKESVILTISGLSELEKLTSINVWVELEKSIAENNKKILAGEMTVAGESIDISTINDLANEFATYSAISVDVDMRDADKKYKENCKNIATLLHYLDFNGVLPLIDSPHDYRGTLEKLLHKGLHETKSYDEYAGFMNKYLDLLVKIDKSLLLNDDGMYLFNNKGLGRFVEDMNDKVFNNKVDYESYEKIIAHPFFADVLKENKLELVLKEGIPSKNKKVKIK